MLHRLVAMRGLIAMGLAATVGAWGLHAHPVDMADPFLGLIEARSPGVFVALVYGYAALWFTTPFFGASLVLSLFAIAASRRDPRIRTRPLPAYVKPESRPAPTLVLGETHFENAHGLNASGHYSSAYDLAMLARYAMTLPDFAGAVSARQWTALGSRTIALTNTNTMLGGYLGADGVKTGFTEEAGRTVVVSAVRNGHRVFVALLDDLYREDSAVALLDWVFQNYQW